jgi:hypothetical protein
MQINSVKATMHNRLFKHILSFIFMHFLLSINIAFKATIYSKQNVSLKQFNLHMSSTYKQSIFNSIVNSNAHSILLCIYIFMF